MDEEERLQARFDAATAHTDGRSLQAQALAGASPRAAQCQASFLVEQGEPAGKGQITKTEFLERMRALVLVQAREILGPFGLAQGDCPDLRYWVDHYSGKDAAYVEQAVRRYAPATREAVGWRECLELLVRHIRVRLQEHARTGAALDPEPAPAVVERARPPLSVLGIQRMPAPVAQRDCASPAATAAPESTGNTRGPGKAASATNLPSAPKPTGAAPLAIESKGESAARTADEIRKRAGELGKLFREGDCLEIGKRLRQNEPPEIQRWFATPESYITDYLNACSSTATALSQHVLGKDITPKAGEDKVVEFLKPKATESKEASWQLQEAFLKLLGEGDAYYHLSVQKASHHFILISIGGKYDLYESDANPGAGKEILFLPAYNKGAASQTGTQMDQAALETGLSRMMTRCTYAARESISITYRRELLPA